MVKPKTLPQAPLPLKIANIVQHASEKSPIGLQELLRLVDLVQAESLAKYSPVLRVFLENLKSECSPNTSDQRKRYHQPMAEVSLHGILAIMKVIGPDWDEDSNALTVPDLVQAWPDIWRWMVQTAAEWRLKVIDNPSLVTTHESMLSTILHIISGFSSCPDTTAPHTLMATPGVFTLVKDIWIKQCDRDPKQFDVSFTCFMSLKLLIPLLNHGAPGVNDLVNAPVEEFKKVASALLSQIRTASNAKFYQHNNCWLGVLEMLFPFTEILARKSPRLDHILLSQKSIADVSHALTFLTSSTTITKGPQSEMLMRRQCVIGCFVYLNPAILQSDGITWITQAVRAGLIPSLLRCSRWGLEDVDNMCLVALESLKRYTSYRSLLRPASEALKDPAIPNLEKLVPRDREFWATWVVFKNTVQERLSLKSEFEKNGKYVMCGAKKCTQFKEDGGTFMLCGGCNRIYYCSKACQQDDWKVGGHREYCKMIARQRAEGKPSPISTNDSEFLRYLALREMCSLLDRLSSTLGKPLASFSENTKGIRGTVVVDLSRVPTKFGVYIAPKPQGKHTVATDIKVVTVIPMGHTSNLLSASQARAEILESLGILFGQDIDRDALGLTLKDDPESPENWSTKEQMRIGRELF